MYYRLTKEIRSNALEFLSNCSIKASDSSKVASFIESMKAQPIPSKDGSPAYLIDDEVAKFICATLDELTIKAKYAVLMLEVRLALSRPVEAVEKKPVEPAEKSAKKK